MAASSEEEVDGGRLLVRPRVGVSLVFGPLRAIQHRFCTSPSSLQSGALPRDHPEAKPQA